MKKDYCIPADEPETTVNTRITVFRMQQIGSYSRSLPPSKNRSTRQTKKMNKNYSFPLWGDWERMKITIDHWDAVVSRGSPIFNGEYFVEVDGIKTIYSSHAPIS